MAATIIGWAAENHIGSTFTFCAHCADRHVYLETATYAEPIEAGDDLGGFDTCDRCGKSIEVTA